MTDLRISPHVIILTDRELDQIRHQEFLRGVERGKFEASSAYRDGPYARNCANWVDGTCHRCGAQHQYFEVDADFKCPHFVRCPGLRRPPVCAECQPTNTGEEG